jgi:hypothetical protein
VEPTLRELRTGSDLVVVLSQRGLARDRALAQRASRGGAPSQPAEGLIDLLIGNAEARSLTAPEVIGRTWLLPTTDRGQEVGRVDVTLTDAGPNAVGNGRRAVPFLWRRIPLDVTFAAEPKVEGIVGKYYAAQAQALLDASLAKPGTGETGTLGTLGTLGILGTLDAAYVPAAKCGVCHPAQHAQWQTQKHAQALESLRRKERLVPECLKCHSEQYRRTGRFVPNLGLADGVQCSTCHGEGTVHSLLERTDRIERDSGEAGCRSCHDAERDPGFRHADALLSIRHWE